MPEAVPAHGAASFFLDATPLLDENWTGIPVVCANIARQLMQAGCHLEFCVGLDVLPRQAVLDALARNTSLFLEHEYRAGLIAPEALAWPAGTVSVGISASVKRLRRVFDVECSVVHDISTILQPQYHIQENIAWHTERVLQDITSNDLTLCISRATMDDLIEYLGADPRRLKLAYNGVEWPLHYPVRAAADLASGIEPYVLVLATREPRKNLSLVLEMLCGWPEFLAEFRCLFVGREGWLTEESAIPPALSGAVAQARIMQTGFVSDYEKYVLLRGAHLTIFPSLFEGFGLPVGESLSVGTPCVASFSSSIPEVGGELATYFDPCSVADLRAAVSRELAAKRKGDATFQAACAAWMERFTWQRTVASMLEGLAPAIEKAARAAR
jgi:glycosyltransferase involved in cell wall biosynthesis